MPAGTIHKLQEFWDKKECRWVCIIFFALCVSAYLATCTWKAGIWESRTVTAIENSVPDAQDKSKPEKKIKLNDSAVFYLAGRYAFSEELYSFEAPPTAPGRPGRDFLYPPFFAMLVWPITVFGFRPFIVIWLLENLALVILSVWLAAKFIGRRENEPVKWWMWLLPLLLTLRAFDANFRQGQANVLTLFFLVAAFAAITCRREFLGGLAYAVACILKITPILILPYFLLKRQWFFLLGWLVGIMCTVIVIPSLLLGPGKAYQRHADFYNKIVDPFVTKAGQNPREGAGQSLHAAVDRFLSPIDASRHDDTVLRLNVVSLSRKARYAIKIILVVLIAAVTGFVCRRKPSENRELLLALEFAAIVAFMLMASPLSRKASFVVMLVPYVAAVHYFSRSQPGGCRIFFTIVFAFSVFTHTFTAPFWFGKTVGTYLLACSIMFFGTLFLWLGFSITLNKEHSGQIEN
ncbi:MAG: DUF2029 domain-containing protein [Planctomycetota bacterium]|nr:MAG: DUF2029 domain-containing protein [Planctomycetota bacterium]